MNNWWIAALEHAGLITQEEAEHLANNIKFGIHRENYDQAYKELEAILGDPKTAIEEGKEHVYEELPVFRNLLAEVDKLKEEIEKLKSAKKTPAVPAPTGVKKTVANTKEA